LAVNALDLRVTETRRRIVETSLLLFAEHGFKGVSARDGASPARTSPARRT
jgi:hypothetical protein